MELSTKAVDLEEELSFKREQLRKTQGVCANLKLANEELEACVSSLNTQILKAQ